MKNDDIPDADAFDVASDLGEAVCLDQRLEPSRTRSP
jgi:hypothetical protein